MSEPRSFTIWLLCFLRGSLREGLRVCWGKRAELVMGGAWTPPRSCLPFNCLPSLLNGLRLPRCFLGSELLEFWLQLTCWCAAASGSLRLKRCEKHWCDLWGWRLYCAGLWKGDLEDALLFSWKWRVLPSSASREDGGMMVFAICVLTSVLGLLVFLNLGRWKTEHFLIANSTAAW